MLPLPQLIIGVKKTTQYSVAMWASYSVELLDGTCPLFLPTAPRAPKRACSQANHSVTEDIPERIKYILLEYLTLGSAGVSHNTNVDISSKVCFLCCHLRHSTKQHEKNTTFNFIISCQEKKFFKSYELQAEDWKDWTSFTMQIYCWAPKKESPLLCKANLLILDTIP